MKNWVMGEQLVGNTSKLSSATSNAIKAIKLNARNADWIIQKDNGI